MHVLEMSLSDIFTIHNIFTLVITYFAVEGSKRWNFIPKQFLPVASMVIAIVTSAGYGWLVDHSAMHIDLVIGVAVGAGSTWLNQLVEHSLKGFLTKVLSFLNTKEDKSDEN